MQGRGSIPRGGTLEKKKNMMKGEYDGTIPNNSTKDCLADRRYHGDSDSIRVCLLERSTMCEHHGKKLYSSNGKLFCWYCRKPYDDGFFGPGKKKEKKK